MKNLYVLLSLFLLLAASHLYAQNDTLYVYKAGNIINKQSIKTVDVDSITFYKPTLVVTVEQSPVQKNLVNMLQDLGLMSVGSTSKTTSKLASQKKGDITELSFIDEYEGAKMSMKINEEESTKDKMVYYGTQTYLDDGQKTDLRYTLTASGDTTIMKKEAKLNGEYLPVSTFELTQNGDKTVTQKEIFKNEKVLMYTYEPNSLTSLTRVDRSGNKALLDNFLIVQK